jgi:1-acyl-sn-glycerol-3-phosphate acyltransferase
MSIDKTFYFWPHKLYMHFLPPVEVDNLKSKELRDKVFDIMKNHYLKNEHNPQEKPTYQ